MGFFSNNSEYSIVTSIEVADVIAHFSEEMILDILDKNIMNRSSFVQKVNLVYSLEQDFKKCLELYPAYSEQINQKRFEIYSAIVEKICNFYGIESIETNDMGVKHSQAFYLYQFFVSDFFNNVVIFFTNYIIREKNSIYELMEQNLSSKTKDFNVSYSKKIYKNLNAKLITIHANLEYVIDNICAFDIDFPTLVQNVYCNNTVVSNFLNGIVSEENGDDLFRKHIVPFVMQNKPVVLTYIKLNLQNLAETNTADLVSQ